MSEAESFREDSPQEYTFESDPYQQTMIRRDSLDALRGATLRVLVPKIEEPYVNYANFTDEEEAERGYGPGVVMELLKDMATELDLKYEIIRTEHERSNSSFLGPFEALRKNEADIIAQAQMMDYDHTLMADLTYPFESVNTGVMAVSDLQHKSQTMLIVTEPFQNQVWLMILASILVSALALYILTRILRRVYDELPFSFLGSTWVFFSIIVQQGIPENPKSWSVRVLISLWWLASLTLMATFTGSLVALFAVQRDEHPFQTFEELVKLVKLGKFKILLDRMQTWTMIQKSELRLMKELYYEMSVNHKFRYEEGISNAVNFLLTNSHFALVGPADILEIYKHTDCRLYSLQEDILPTYLSIALRKDSPYTNYFSDRIHELFARGFTKKWIQDFGEYIASKTARQCNATSVNAPNGTLSLMQAQGAFWILIGGMSVSIVALLLELLFHLIKKKACTEDGRIAQLKKRFKSMINKNC
ncbi:unnamed protein product [Cylicocyclus nassatus]|uniref:Ionotropic glutamate receptor C-terminal domain-containing protein n=1 Tax=Cylicocyclus nassatus TaxID=53992 RepID=A0AA36GM25_CYLNA|nr:unnamed protein product [Cylicocyclus nassatus]